MPERPVLHASPTRCRSWPSSSSAAWARWPAPSSAPSGSSACPPFFPDNDIVPLLTSSLGLLVLLLYFPGGLVQIGYGARAAILELDGGAARPGAAEERQHAVPARRAEARPSRCRRASPRSAPPTSSVRFGGIHRRRRRVDRGARGRDRRAHRHQRRRQVDAHERHRRLRLRRRDRRAASATPVDRPAVAARARLGLGRSFQAATLFPELTVRETVLVALEARKRTGMLSTALFLPPAIRQRAGRRRSEADELIDFLGLGRYADMLHRRPVDRHPPHRRAGRPARPRRPLALPRRADRRRRPAGDRGLRPAHRGGPPRARRRRCSSSSTTCR